MFETGIGFFNDKRSRMGLAQKNRFNFGDSGVVWTRSKSDAVYHIKMAIIREEWEKVKARIDKQIAVLTLVN